LGLRIDRLGSSATSTHPEIAMATNDDRIRLAEMITGFQVTQAIHVAASIGLADLLAKGPLTPADLAAKTRCDAGALERLLHALTALEVLQRDEVDRFSLTGIGQFLRRDVMGTQAHRAEMVGHAQFWHTWGNFDYSLRTGQRAFDRTHGTDGWSYRNAHPDERACFDSAMSADATWMADAFINACDLSRFHHFVDLGGGDGTLIAAILARYPRARATLFDQPGVTAHARENLAKSCLTYRCSVVSGDFFQGVPPGGDAYLLKWILHDWRDDECVRILRQCRNAMTGAARLIVVEYLADRDKPTRSVTLMDLNMMVMNGGRERTRDEFAALFAKAGLRLCTVVPTASMISIMEAVPADIDADFGTARK
jgi:O-methyltransferase domain/Dimerisation domain